VSTVALSSDDVLTLIHLAKGYSADDPRLTDRGRLMVTRVKALKPDDRVIVLGT
jgi:hypothetical protein